MKHQACCSAVPGGSPLRDFAGAMPWNRMCGLLLAALALATFHVSLRAAGFVPLGLAEDAGADRMRGPVTSGVPFPQGALKSDAQLRLLDEKGQEVPLQARTTATWRDGSVKWVLLDFQSDVPAGSRRAFRLEYGQGVNRSVPAAALEIREREHEVAITTGPLSFSVPRKELGLLRGVSLDRDSDGAFQAGERVLADGLDLALMLDQNSAGLQPRVQPPEEVKVEEAGPLRAVLRITGWVEDGSTNRLFRYDVRVHALAGSAQLRLFLTLTQLSDQAKMLWVRDFSLVANLVRPTTVGLVGGQPLAHRVAFGPGREAVLTQPSEGSYTLTNTDGTAGRGFHAPGWAEMADASAGLLVACRHFWQQFPKSLTLAPGSVRVGFYPGQAGQPFDWDQGLAKTHELLLDFHTGSLDEAECARRATALEHPLFAIAPARWYCDSKVFGELLPFDFDLFPDYETLTEASGDQFVKRMTTGLRHWGDVYYGGEYKGTNSYTNLEYDMHHNFLCQFARTGLRKYLDPALVMAQHQADIDTNHKTGWQWKHSPRHVEIQAEFGHTFTRGLLEAYFLSGNRRCLEAALELGDYFARDIRNPRSTGNERQIGWALISLLPVYEATWDGKYFEAASNTVERLLAGLEDTGKFRIRWDNRIAFFNGIAATGFIYYYRATGDERVAEAALRVLRRARGFYPEYAGRTLEAIAWACERTGEPEWTDFLARTWETTLARQISWNVMELGAPTIFTVHALPFLVRSGVLTKPEQPFHLTPDQCDTARGLHTWHLPAGEADCFLELASAEPIDLAVIRKGAWKSSGTARLHAPDGRPIRTLTFPRESAIWQRQMVNLRDHGTGSFRLALRSPGAANVRGGSYVTWDVLTSRPVRAVFSIPGHKGLQFVTPRLFAAPQSDSDRIELEVAAEGEGFKRAILFDPAGQVAGSVEVFIDLGDRGRYFHKVAAAIPSRDRSGVWSLSLEGVTIEKMTGLTPFFATSEKSFFRPDRLQP